MFRTLPYKLMDESENFVFASHEKVEGKNFVGNKKLHEK